MAGEVFIIFPNQLFESLPSGIGQEVWLIEEYLFFKQFDFHPLKLIFQRASMQAYADFLRKQGYSVRYIENSQQESDVRVLPFILSASGIFKVHTFQPIDNWLQKRLEKGLANERINLVFHKNPSFLASSFNDEIPKRDGRFYQTAFYVNQRRRFKLFLDTADRPLGGKWTFDTENRRRWPTNKKLPAIQYPPPSRYWQEAIHHVKGNHVDTFEDINFPVYPHTHDQARSWLDDFLRNRLRGFGTWQDAMVSGASVLHHSLLSPLLNAGLLLPDQIVSKVLEYASQNDIPLNDVEGFIRQVMGWREYIASVYVQMGSYQRTKNFWGFTRKMPRAFYEGSTGLLPFDEAFSRLQKTAYSHHIERLMIFGNLMLLCEIHPDEVYQWFMEHYIDAYDWVMVPNVYGMSQYADGGVMTTKPYISASAYLLRMSDYPAGVWTHTWDALFWRFMHVHREVLIHNPRLNLLLKSFDRMSTHRQEELLREADEFLSNLY